MRRQLTWHVLSSSLAGLLALGMAVPAVAVQQDRQDRAERREDREQRREQRQEQRRDQRAERRDNFQRGSQDRDVESRDRQRDQRQRDQQARDGRQVRVEPQGWVRIAVDRDNDGRFDAVETIYMYDLEMAQQRSQQRDRDELDRRSGDTQREGRRRWSDQQDRQQRDRSAQQRRQSRRHEIEGTVRELSTVQLPGHDDQFLTARVQTEEGRTGRVMLGAEKQLERLDLEEGDRVTVSGRPGFVNDRMMLIALEIEANDETVRPQPASREGSRGDQDRYRSSDQERDRASQQDRRDRSRPWEQERDRSSQREGDGDSVQELEGEVLNTRAVRFRGRAEPYVVGDVRLESGERAHVNFGPQSNFRDVDLEKGKDVQIKARRGRIGGRNAWIAEEVQFEESDETVDVDI